LSAIDAPAAKNRLSERHIHMVYRIAYRMSGYPDVAADHAQDALHGCPASWPAPRSQQVLLRDEVNGINGPAHPGGNRWKKERAYHFAIPFDRRKGARADSSGRAANRLQGGRFGTEPRFPNENALPVDSIRDDVPFGRVPVPVSLRRLPGTEPRQCAARELRNGRATEFPPGL
jgi:hypothetical protein